MIHLAKLNSFQISQPFKRFYYMKISDILTNKVINEKTTVKGWVKLVRKMKKLTFIDISDGSTFKYLQLVLPPSQVPENVGKGASIEASGELKMMPSGQIEMHPNSIKLIGACDYSEGFPFSEKIKYEQDQLREHLHFRPRTSKFASALRIRDKVTHCIHDYFQREKFVNIQTPMLTSNDCEGAGELFQVMPESKSLIEQMKKAEKTEKEAFFDRNVFLTVSSQLHLETMARALCNVYQFGPVFRAENSKSRFHLSEFYMLEAEIAFIKNIEELLSIIEKMLKTITENILNAHEEEILFYRKSIGRLDNEILKNVLNKSFHIMDFDEACSILKANNDKLSQPLTESKHVSREHELFLVEHCAAPVFLVNWPINKKPFYTKSRNESYVDAVDLLFPEVGELCGGSIREDNYDTLKSKLIENQLMDKLEWYLDLRKFGNVNTGGFGMGFERYLKVLMGTPSIKDTIPFPRWPHNCAL